VWARVHKIDRVRPQPDGGAIILIEDERNAGAIMRLPSLSTLIAIARVLNARRVLETRYGGKGEVRYATSVSLPDFMFDAVSRAGAAISDRTGETVTMPVSRPGAVASIVDRAFAELAHYIRSSVGQVSIADALRTTEARRRKAPLDRETNPAAYWSSVLELAALAGELSRARGGRWIETGEMPVPFAIKLAEGGLAMPTKLAQQIVEGAAPEASLATE
jgi:hypothetical protein